MPFDTQPQFYQVSPYRPVVFDSWQYFNASNPADRAIVSLYVGGVFVNSFYVKPYKISEPFPGIFKTNFLIDLSNNLQQKTAPFAGELIHLNQTFGIEYLPSYSEFFYIEVDYKTLNLSTGLLEDWSGGITDTSDDFAAIAIPRQNNEDMYLNTLAGDMAGAASVDSFAPYLSSMPNNRTACKNKRLPISVYAENQGVQMSAAFVEAFDKDGNSLGTMVIGGGGGGAAISAIFTIDFELSSLTSKIDEGFNIPTSSVIVLVDESGTTMSNPTDIPELDPLTFDYDVIDSLVINFGTIVVTGIQTYTQRTENITIKLKSGCGCLDDRKGLTLHWLNNQSGVDSYTFDTNVKHKQSIKSKLAKKSLSWDETSTTPHNAQDIGTFKTSNLVQNLYEVKTDLLMPTLSKGIGSIFSSLKIYREDSEGNLVSVVITDAEIIDQDSLGKTSYSLTVTDSNNASTQIV